MKSCISLLALSALLAGCPPQQPESRTSSAPPPAPTANPWPVPGATPAGAAGEQIAYGKELIAHTSRYLGPEAKDPALRLAGNRLSCGNCHLELGTHQQAMGFVGLARRFPAYYAPLDRKISLSERIDACFERSLNGKPLPPQGRELQAMAAYVTWLSQDVPAELQPSPGPDEVPLPARAARLGDGEKLYAYHCSACHGHQGEGVLIDDAHPGQGYTFPPLWGKDSFGLGSNMARQLIATRYIKANMPLGRPVLSSEQAYDIAAYLLSRPRPAFAGAGKDYPNPKTRPVDVPYGPYADTAPAGQHRLGPFAPLLSKP